MDSRTPKLTVAVSGGPDSMYLLRYLSRKPGRVVRVVHLMYPPRTPEQGEFLVKAEGLVRAAAAEWCPEAEYLLIPQELGTESSGSTTRRGLYEEIYHKHDTRVAVGHTLDDAYEWFLIRTLRYHATNPFMKKESGAVVRPLLFERRTDVRRRAMREGVPFLDDPTNLRTDEGCLNARARIRSDGLVDSIRGTFGVTDRSFLRALKSHQ